MRRRDLLKLGPAAVLAILLRPQFRAAVGRRVRRSKPFVAGLERGGLGRADVRRIEERG